MELGIGATACKFAQPEEFNEFPIPMHVAHGEGRFYGRDMDVLDLENNGQVVFRYVTKHSTLADGKYPDNPNGSMLDIAGICDPSGLILGMMPHPERSIAAFHPDIDRRKSARSAAEVIFKNIIHYARAS